MKSIHVLLLAFAFSGSAQASVITNQITGWLAQFDYGASPVLDAISGESFTAVLSYDSSSTPTEVWAPHFSNYASAGSVTFITSLGTANAQGVNLQTFLFGGSPGGGTNFNGYGTNAILSGSWSTLILESVDFQFQSSPSGSAVGLTSFNLPSPLVLSNFDGNNFVRLTFSSRNEFGQKSNLNLIGVITAVSAVPEPETYALIMVGLCLVGTIAHRRNATATLIQFSAKKVAP